VLNPDAPTADAASAMRAPIGKGAGMSRMKGDSELERRSEVREKILRIRKGRARGAV